MKIKVSLHNSTISKCANILDRREKRKVIFITAAQITLSFIDLIGVALIGALGALAVRGVQSQGPGDRVAKLLEFLNLNNFDFRIQAGVIAAAASIILVGKTILTVVITRRTMFYMSHRGAILSDYLMSRFITQPLNFVRTKNVQDTIYSLSGGVTAITMGILSTLIGLIADITLLIVMSVGLLIVSPTVAISSVIMFAAIGFSLYFLQQVRAHKLGVLYSQLNIKSNQQASEIVLAYREMFVHNRQSHFREEFLKTRLQLSGVQAEISFMPQISKYVIESSVIVGSIVIAGIQFFTQDASRAVATLAVFVAAGSRIAPAILRVQQGLVSLKTNAGAAIPTLNMLDELSDVQPLDIRESRDKRSTTSFVSTVSVKNLGFKYKNSSHRVLDDISFEIKQGEQVAIVGASGSGKTTLVDLILGINQPNEGQILISGLPPEESIEQWPSKISYVPQEVYIQDSNLEENIRLGFNKEDYSHQEIVQALKSAQFSLDKIGINSMYETGENGSRLSGGQKQRVGIARALLTNPEILVLDEATSSLDGFTEAEISKTFADLKGSCTIIIIAHRLSTIKKADYVVFLEKGKIRAKGTIKEVRSLVPDFDLQCTLMGLAP
jgi:ABC-type multidrug transport system fused ATPase/permease subunit